MHYDLPIWGILIIFHLTTFSVYWLALTVILALYRHKIKWFINGSVFYHICLSLMVFAWWLFPRIHYSWKFKIPLLDLRWTCWCRYAFPFKTYPFSPMREKVHIMKITLMSIMLISVIYLCQWCRYHIIL